MVDDKPSGAWGSSFVVLAFAAVSALYVAHDKPPLVSSRPTGTQYPVYELRARQDLGARLWEDPFAAVMREVGELCGLEPQEIIRHTTAGFKQTAKDQTLMLGVTLPGAHYRRSPRPGVDCAMP